MTMKLTIPKTQADIVAAVLPTERALAMTTQDIYDALDPADQGRFGHAGNVGKALDQMKRRNKGVAHGDSEIVNRQAKLTWYKIDENPQAAKAAPVLDPQTNDEPVVQAAPEETVLEPVRRAALLADVAESPEVAPVVVEASVYTDQLVAKASAVLTENALETLARDGYLILDPFSETDQFICEVVNLLKQAAIEPPQPVRIRRKAMKIKALTLIAESPLLQTDIANFLMEIADDIKQLDEAA